MVAKSKRRDSSRKKTIRTTVNVGADLVTAAIVDDQIKAAAARRPEPQPRD